MYHLRPMENNIFVNLDWYYSWYYALRSKDTTHFLGKHFRLKISIFIIRCAESKCKCCQPHQPPPFPRGSDVFPPHNRKTLSWNENQMTPIHLSEKGHLDLRSPSGGLSQVKGYLAG